MNDKEREALLNEFLTEEGDITIMKEKAKYHESNSPFKGLKNLKLNEIKDVNRPRTATLTTPRQYDNVVVKEETFDIDLNNRQMMTT